MKDKKYMIDNELASADDIIKKAREYDTEYDESHFYQTSVAAKILREHNHEVKNNPNL